MRDSGTSTPSRDPSVLKLVLTMLEWMLAAALLIIAAVNVGPDTTIMLGAVALIAILIILRNRHHRRHPDMASGVPDISGQIAARHRYFPEHPGSNLD